MRRSVVYYLGGFFVVTFILLGFIYLSLYEEINRHHQHQVRPSEADLGYCVRCNHGDTLCTHLPVMIIDTMGASTIPGRPVAFYTGDYRFYYQRHFVTAPYDEEEIQVLVSVIDNYNDWNHESDMPAHESLAMMRIRGNSSRYFDKASYRIRLVDGDEDNYLPLLGMDPHFEWALHGPFLDKTLMRNYVWMNIAAEVMGPEAFVPEVRFFELIIDGEFMGLYILMETIRVNPSRVYLTRYRRGMPATSYLVRFNTFSHTPERRVDTFATYSMRLEGGNSLELLYPRLLRQTDTTRDYVARSVSRLEQLMYSMEIVHNPGFYERYIDINSFVNFYIINEFIANNDLWAGSTYFHKDIHSRLTAGPVWDFNNVTDNFFLTMPVDEFLLADRGWFDRLMMCPHFTDRVIRRWHNLRGGILAEERLIAYKQDVEDWLGSAIGRNFDVWGYSFDPSAVSPMARRRPTYAQAAEGLTIFDLNPSSFDEAVDQALEFMITRGRWLDSYIETLRQFSHTSRHALWVLQ